MNVVGPPAESRVVTLGEVMALLLADPGHPVGSARGYEFGLAGAEATVAIGLARLGHQATYVTLLGADPLGRQVLRELRADAVDVSAVRLVEDAPTGLLVRDAVTDRPISVLYYREGSAASRLAPTDFPADLLDGASVLHLTGITAMLSESARQTVLYAAHAAKERGVPVCFDPNVRHKLADADQWRALIREMTPLADFVLTGRDEAALVTDDGDPARWFHERGARIVVVKDGSRGAWESDGTTVTQQAVRPTVAVDPVGAGDAFAAGWLSGWLDGVPPADRLARAATVASLVVGSRGDIPGLPDAAQLQQVISTGTDVER